MPVQQRRPQAPLTPLASGARRVVVLLALVPLLAVGCAGAQGKAAAEAPGAEAASESEVASLRRENAALRTRLNNVEERVRMLEQDDDWASVAVTPIEPNPETYTVAETVPGSGADGGPRELPVVKLTPRERSIDSRPAGQGPRPVQATRPSGSIALSPVPHSGVPEHLAESNYYVDARGYEETTTAADASAPGPAVDPSAEPASYRLVGSRLVEATKAQPKTVTRPSKGKRSKAAKAYEAAMAVYKDGRYAEAEKAFAAIVRAHPNDDYADNALYWQGESAYDQAHYADALKAFTAVVERYGGGNKAPDALLKIGLCYGRLGDADNARDVLTQLIAAYPRAAASKIAKRKLADL